jgi:hypothetical protein
MSTPTIIMTTLTLVPMDQPARTLAPAISVLTTIIMSMLIAMKTTNTIIISNHRPALLSSWVRAFWPRMTLWPRRTEPGLRAAKFWRSIWSVRQALEKRLCSNEPFVIFGKSYGFLLWKAIRRLQTTANGFWQLAPLSYKSTLAPAVISTRTWSLADWRS